MISLNNSIALIFLVLFFISPAFSQSYKIRVKVNGLHGDSLFLGHYYADKIYAVDTCVTDNKGVGVFSKKKELEGGLYNVLFPGRNMSFFEIIITAGDQEMNLETDTADFVSKMKIKGSKENELFYDFQRKMAVLKKVALNLQKRYTANKENKDSTKFLSQKLDSIGKVKDNYWDKVIKDNPNTLFSNIVKAMSEIKIPDFDIDKNVKDHDSLVAVLRYNYNVSHYFDNIDFTDPRLLRTPFVQQRLKQYLEKELVPNFDTLTKAAIMVIEKSRVNKEFFKYMVITCTNYFLTSQIMGFDGVFVNLAEKYYLSGEATWADTSVMKQMNKYVKQFKPNMIGKTAHDLKLETNNGDAVTLHQVKAKYTVVVFWEPSCGHCKKEIPLMHEKYSKWKEEGVEVFAVYTQVDEKEWNEFIEKHELEDWINAFDRYQRSGFRNYYNVDRTPMVYLIDENKKIIAKRLGVEDLDKMIDRLANGLKK
jgi:peroxiredoxin